MIINTKPPEVGESGYSGIGEEGYSGKSGESFIWVDYIGDGHIPFESTTSENIDSNFLDLEDALQDSRIMQPPICGVHNASDNIILGPCILHIPS